MAKDDVEVEVASRIAEIPAAAWDACANPEASTRNPFISHAFLRALEESECATPKTGWAPRHLALKDASGGIAAVMPAYVKSHSRGEYIFDHGWADAYERAGGQYYPKLQCAVPFTPVPGRRLLVRPGSDSEDNERLLTAAAIELAKRHGCSSLHITFLTEGEWTRLGRAGFLQRIDRQFHWQNNGYATFDDFLASLASRKRKAIRKERAEATAPGISIEWLRGPEIREAHWDAFFRFYMDTGSRKWGRPYLNRKAFSLFGETLGSDCLLVMAKRAGRYIAGALNLVGGDCLYGRYWGAVEHHPCLHFEVCYYQSIDFAIAHGLPRVEAGAQGEHKLARGYLPTPTYAAYWIANASFRKAVARYLAEERSYMRQQIAALAEFAPFKRTLEYDGQG